MRHCAQWRTTNFRFCVGESVCVCRLPSRSQITYESGLGLIYGIIKSDPLFLGMRTDDFNTKDDALYNIEDMRVRISKPDLSISRPMQ